MCARESGCVENGHSREMLQIDNWIKNRSLNAIFFCHHFRLFCTILNVHKISRSFFMQLLNREELLTHPSRSSRIFARLIMFTVGLFLDFYFFASIVCVKSMHLFNPSSTFFARKLTSLPKRSNFLLHFTM